jgi:hypothetical protein
LVVGREGYRLGGQATRPAGGREEALVAALALFLLLVLILFGAGFALHVLWWVAVIALVVWLVGLAAHGPERRWYRW